jgi:hypothetical protein
MGRLSTILALLVLLVALGTALGLVAGAHLLWWLIAALALAFLLNGYWPLPWPPRR